MPIPLLNTFATKSGKPLAHVEKCWKQAKEQVTKEYKAKESDGARFFRLAVGITKKMLNLDEYNPWDDPRLSGVAIIHGQTPVSHPPRAGRNADVGGSPSGTPYDAKAKPFKEQFSMKVTSVQRFVVADPSFILAEMQTARGLGTGRWQPSLQTIEMLLPVSASVAVGQIVNVSFDFK